MSYASDKKPGELTALTSLATDDVFVVGDTSDTSEVAKGITKANLITDLTTSFAPALTADQNYVSDAQLVVVGNTSGTNTGDNAVNSNYSGLVTNATHTGEVTGATALTVDKTAITGKTAVTAEGTDYVLISDTSDSGNLKKALASDLAGSALSDGDKGDITVSASGATWTIDAGAVTLAKQADMATASVVYRKTAGSGAPEVNTLATLKTDLGLSNTNSGDQTTIVGISGTMAQFDTAVSDGNIVYQSQALGTPASGTLTNCTGYPAASTTASGIAEASIASEVNTGTDAARYVSPDSLAGSNLGIRYATVTLNGTTALTTSEKAYFRIPAALTGMNLVSVAGTVGTGAAGSSSSGTPTFTVKNVTDANQMLSTSLTVDAGEYTSATAATPAVINASFDDVVTDDLIEVAVTTSGTGVTYATITLGFQLA